MQGVEVVIKRSAKHRRMLVEAGVPFAQVHNRTDLIATGEDRGGEARLKARSTNPLVYYHKRRLLDDAQVRAGMRLGRVFEAFNFSALRAALMDGTHGDGYHDRMTERQADAWKAYKAALEAIPGHTGQLMVRNVCCYGELIRDGVYPHYRNVEHAMSRFREAMDALAEHYA